MYEPNECDYGLDGDGAWETVSKNKKTKDRIKMDQRPVAQARKPVAKRMMPVVSSGTRRPVKQGNTSSAGRKPVPSTNWRETAKKKAESTEMQKKVLLKNVQIGRSAKPLATPDKQDKASLSSRSAASGRNAITNDTTEGKFDSFQEYNESFPDLQKGNENRADLIQSGPVQHYANVQSFYESNGYDVTADVMQALNAMFMNSPGIPSLLDPSPGHGGIAQLNVGDQGYPISDGLANSSYVDNESYTGCSAETGFKDCNMFLSAVPTGGEVNDIPHENHFNIPVNEVLPGAMETQGTSESGQECKVMNAPVNVNMLHQSRHDGKQIAKKQVFDEKPVLGIGEKSTHIESTRQLVEDNDTNSATCARIPFKRKKIKEQSKASARHRERQEQNGVLVKQRPNFQVANQNDQKELSTPNESIAILDADIEEKIDAIVDTCNDGNVNMLGSKAVDSNANDILMAGSNTVFKSDNQNNNCQDAGAGDEDDSCLELTGMESMCIPDYFQTEDFGCSRSEQKATGETTHAEMVDVGTLQGKKEEACPEVILSSKETKNAEEIGTQESVEMMIECVQTNNQLEKEMKEVKVSEKILNTEKNEENNQEITKDNTQEHGMKMSPKDIPNTNYLEKKQVECTEAVKEEIHVELTADRKLTYGDVIEYVMEQLKELYSGKDSFLPVTRIEHDALPDELTGHLNVLRQLAYNYTPTSHQCDSTTNSCSESSYSDSSDSSEYSAEHFEGTTPIGLPEQDLDKTLLKRFHEKLHVFAQLNHLHQVVSNPTLAAMVEDYKLIENKELLTCYGYDLFPDLTTGSLSRGESVGKSSTSGVPMGEGPRGNISVVQNGGENVMPCISLADGNSNDVGENLVTTGRNPVSNEHAHQHLESEDPTSTHFDANIPLLEERDLKCLETKDVPGGDSLKSLISSPHHASAKGLQFFQHSFLSSPENLPGDAIDSQQRNSDMNAADMRELSEGSSPLVDIRRFLRSQMTGIKASLDREMLNSLTSRQQEHEEEAGQGGDMIGQCCLGMGPSKEHTAESATKVTTGVMLENTTEYHIEDEDVLCKGWIDRTLVECLANPKDEGPTENSNRRQHRTKKFRALPYWWMP